MDHNSMPLFAWESLQRLELKPIFYLFRFKIKCCRSDDYITYDCTTSPYINDWNDIMSYNVPPRHFMVGLFSYHRNDKE